MPLPPPVRMMLWGAQPDCVLSTDTRSVDVASLPSGWTRAASEGDAFASNALQGEQGGPAVLRLPVDELCTAVASGAAKEEVQGDERVR